MYISALITILPAMNIDKASYIFLGYLLCVLMTIKHEKTTLCFCEDVLVFIANYSLFLVLLSMMNCNSFGFFYAILTFLAQILYKFIENSSQSDDSCLKECNSKEPPWKNIIKSMCSGLIFLLKVRKSSFLVDSSNFSSTGPNNNNNKPFANLEKYLELVIINDKGKELNLMNLRDCLNFVLKEFEVIKVMKQEFSNDNMSNYPEFEYEENDQNKLLSQRELNEETGAFPTIINFLKAIITKTKEIHHKKYSISLGTDLLINFGRLFCTGRVIKPNTKQMNYSLLISEFSGKNFTTHEDSFLLFEFVERTEENMNSTKEIYNFKDQMLANVAHDLRSPINGILSFIDLSIEAKEEKERLKNLEYAKISGVLLLNLVSDILDFSVIKEGKLKINIQPFSLKDLIDETINLMRLQAQMKHLKINVQSDIDTFFYLKSDRRRLSQLLINLLNNSIKFTNKGHILLKISKTSYQNVIKFEIKDTGIGIKPEILPHLFKPFATFDTDQGINKYGIGLGLNICKMIVALLGPCENLFVSSVYHKGTKFGFLLFTNIKEKTVQNSSNKNSGNKMDDYKSNVIFNEICAFGMLNKKKIKRKKIKPFTTINAQKTQTTKKKAVVLTKVMFSGKRRVKSEEELLKKGNRMRTDESLLLRKYLSDDVKQKLPLQKKINTVDYFSNYYSPYENSLDSLKYADCGDGFSEFEQKRRKSYEITSLIDRRRKLPFNFSSTELNDDINENIHENAYGNINRNINRNLNEIFNENILENSHDNPNENSNENSSINTKFNEKDNENDEFNTSESPVLLINSRKLNNMKFMRGNSAKSADRAKMINKKMISTQECNLFMDREKRKVTLNILLVDDNPFNILILTEYLKKLKGYIVNILTAHNGAVALEIFEASNRPNSLNPIEMILMDCQMPILDGYETAKCIRDLISERTYQSVFIIAITAYQDEKKCLDAGMNSFLMKPVHEKDFIDAIKMWLDG